jgi:hypothetical protein
MTLKKLLLALTAFVGAAAYAQTPLGSVVSVQGVATATQGATGMTVTPGMPIQNGTRIVTTSNSTVTVRLNSGCTVTLPGGHGVTVLETMTCQQLVAAVAPVVPVVAAAAFGPSAAVVNGTIAVGGLLIGAAIISEAANDNDPAPAPAISGQ